MFVVTLGLQCFCCRRPHFLPLNFLTCWTCFFPPGNRHLDDSSRGNQENPQWRVSVLPLQSCTFVKEKRGGGLLPPLSVRPPSAASFGLISTSTKAEKDQMLFWPENMWLFKGHCPHIVFDIFTQETERNITSFAEDQVCIYEYLSFFLFFFPVHFLLLF